MDEDPPPSPADAGLAVRPSRAEREAAEQRLTQAVSDGRLNLEEFGDRLGLVLKAPSVGELERVTADLPAPEPQARPATGIGQSGRPRQWLVAVMSGFEAKGKWRPAPHTIGVAVMGGGEINLGEARLADGRLKLTLAAVMGGIEVVVPDGVDVRMSGFAFMGGREDTTPEPAVEGGPTVHIRAFALMGGIEVRPETKKERRKRQGETPAKGAADRPARRGERPDEVIAPGSHGSQGSWWGRLVGWGLAGLLAVGLVTGNVPRPDAIAVMSGTQRTVSQAALEAGDASISAFALMGGVEIIVPPGTRVENSALGFMGGVDCEACGLEPDPDAPVVQVSGLAVMGGITVETTEQARGGGDRALERALDVIEDGIDEAEDRGDDTTANALRRQRDRIERQLD